MRYQQNVGSLLINMLTDTRQIYWSRCVSQHIDRHIGLVLVEISADMSVDVLPDVLPDTSWSTHRLRVGWYVHQHIGWASVDICWPTYRLRGAQTTHDPSFNTGNCMPYSSWIMIGFFNIPHWTYERGRYFGDGAYSLQSVLIWEDLKV